MPADVSNPVCCGTTVIDSDKQTCCEAIGLGAAPFDKQTGFACCGASYINNDEQVCCGYAVHQKTISGKCCGNKYYSFLQETCAGSACSGGVVCEGVGDTRNIACGECSYDSEKTACSEVFFYTSTPAAVSGANAVSSAFTGIILLSCLVTAATSMWI